MKKTSILLQKLAIGISFFLMVIITIPTIFYITDDFTYLQKLTEKPYLIIWTISLVLLISFYHLFRIINRMNEKKTQIAAAIVVVFMVGLQLIVLFGLDIIHTTDDFYIMDQAKALVDGTKIQIETNQPTGYFSIYGNNYFPVIITKWLFQLASVFHVTDLDKVLSIFNLFCIDGAVLFLYLLLKREKSVQNALKALILCAFNPITYTYIHWTYTNSYSFVFMTLNIDLYYRLKRQDTIWKRYLLVILMGLSVVIGYYIRPTSLIPVMAIVIYEVLAKFRMSKEELKIFKTGIMHTVIAFVLAFGIMLLTYSGINKTCDKAFVSRDLNFPITHWLMMGIHDDFDFNWVRYTASFPTKEEKVEANLENIKEAISDYGAKGLIKHFWIKTPSTWLDGNASGSYRNRQTFNKSNALYRLWNGNMTDFWLLYCQAFRICCYVFMLYAIARLFMRKELDTDFILLLSMAGGIIFYAFWESKAAYSSPFLFAMFGVIADVEPKEQFQKIRAKVMPVLSVFLLIMSIVFGIKGMNIYTSKETSMKDRVILCGSKEFSTGFSDISQTNGKIVQEFYPNAAFNSISIYASLLPGNHCEYNVDVYGSDKLMKSFTIDETKIKSHWITLSFKNRLVPVPDEKYELVITPKQPGEADSIIFTHHFSDAYDEYKGNAIVNDEVKPYDFLLQVNNKYEAAPLSINVYFMFVGILIALCLLNIGWGVLENLNMTQTSEENV